MQGRTILMEIELELIPGEPTLEQKQAHRKFWDWYIAQVISEGNLNKDHVLGKIS